MQIAVSNAYRAQSDQRQWMATKRTGKDAWEGIAHFDQAAGVLAWLRANEPGIPAAQLADLEWVAAAEKRYLAELWQHPKAQGITY